MQIFKDQAFEDRSFVLEEVCFINCVVKNCDFFYSGGDFEWINTTFEACRFHWRGSAKNALALFQALGMLKEQAPPPQVTKSSGRTLQ
jgi:hypothetical protein